jgi:hypothetical protein
VRSAQVASGVVAAVLLVPLLSAGQAMFPRDAPTQPGARTWLERRAKLPPYQPRRLPDGRPDLQGRWGGSSSGDTLEATEYVDVTTPPAESWIGDPTDGLIPYRAWALAKRNEHRAGLARGWPGESGARLHVDPQTFCLKSVPRYAQRGFELVQKPDQVVMLLNWGHYFRVIPTDGRSRPGPAARFWMGSARGRWDGDTLVVDVTNLNGRMWLDSVGNFVGPNARIVERFRLVGPGEMDYEVTIDDPEVFTGPWKLNYVLERAGAGGGNNAAAADPYAAESWEHACHEGNEHHIEGAKALGFTWYPGVTPPAGGSR